ncbi:tyrosine-type recombinase/integrase [Xylella taiwanensis]|uniref:Tyrosine-type recombinase/integrase n=2 Tax=Xylella taiwanensis TaxID=1444770 RepID=A0ABS8TT08_9GAMM|nr:tyrosine-type recombinase/integrase [Xylella taiwanensis]AXI82891.1 integrase [Xylella taiwanensis]AXI83406.1 integrase [Xylella taiwanensis]MCD8455907.1 tyrosine-type recombinase/integrase [Xylella taiwanensis]MCD8458311.1 tyrosine-type recombinase/integrase [Xylella taiwanensis]MCD8460449.1 tyrosine-type recombinase/integrase [Xylella taiwanensis]
MRPKSSHRDLPPRMLRRVRVLNSGKVWESFYYNGRTAQGRRIEIPLGRDLNEAKRKWATLECCQAPADTSLLRFIFDRYAREVIPAKAPKTQKLNKNGLITLRKVFDAVNIDTVTPQHIAQYRDKRGLKTPVSANREIALLSHIWNMAREWGYTAKENPVRGVRKNREKPREFYADDAVWAAVYAKASHEIKDAMDLSYLTGQRPADVLKMRFSDIKDAALEVQQNKTRKKLRILLESDGVRTGLGEVIDRIKARKRKVVNLFLVATPTGNELNEHMLRSRFDRARSAAAQAAGQAGDIALAKRIRTFQFRDIRPKAASELPLEHASKLLGHTEQDITERVYRRVGEVVKPTK